MCDSAVTRPSSQITLGKLVDLRLHIMIKVNDSKLMSIVTSVTVGGYDAVNGNYIQGHRSRGSIQRGRTRYDL